MRYIRLTNNKIIDTQDVKRPYGCNDKEYFTHDKMLILQDYECYDSCGCYCERPVVHIVGYIKKESDDILDLIEPGDIIFYFDFHSQKEQCMYLNDILSIKDINITKLLVPVKDNYECVAKAHHEITELSGMKYVTTKGKLEVI